MQPLMQSFMHPFKKHGFGQRTRLCAAALLFFALSACGGGGANDPQAPPPVTADDPPTNAGPPNDSIATAGCSNVVIANGVGYAACGQEIELVELATLTRALVAVPAADLTVDAEAGLLFTQQQNSLTALSLTNPIQPVIVDSTTTNFSAFSGVAASAGVLVVSGGAGSADTEIYTYTSTQLSLQTAGIPAIDATTGNPDVTLGSSGGNLLAFYSQDTGAVANWAIQIATLDLSGQVLSVANDAVLTAGAFPGGSAFSTANFPVESELLGDQLFVAHFAAQGIEVVDLANGNQVGTVIPLPYEPTNIATDGELLFVVGLNHDAVDIIDPASGTVMDSLFPEVAFGQPVGVAASTDTVIVADRVNGLVVIAR